MICRMTEVSYNDILHNFLSHANDTGLAQQITSLIPVASTRVIAIDGRLSLPSSQSMKVSQVEIAAIDPDFDRGYRLYP